MTHQEYWKKREDEALKHYIADEEAYDREVKRIYADMLDSCNEQINAFYGKYAAAENISLAEAKKRVSKLDIAAYERKAKRYVKEKDFSEQANEEMRLYNAAMKINRLEMLKANIGLELITGHDELEKFMGGVLQGRTEEELKRQAGILGKTITNNAETANAIVNASFHNATFSDRIWMYQDLMKDELSKLLQTGLIQGKNPRALARDLQKRFEVSAKNAERLMRTELARVQTEAQKQSFERNGFEQYTFLANTGCCDACQSLDGKHFKVADMMPGENAAPIHPNCRCSVAAYSDRKEYDEWLDYLEKGGTTDEWEKRKKKLENSEKSGIMEMNRKTHNTGSFSNLPEKMSKKHIRELAKEYGVDLKGLTINIDKNEELLRIPYTGRADPEKVGGITFFPNAFKSKEELIRTLYHEKVHVAQFKEYGIQYVQDNREMFEQLAYDLEDKFISKLKEEGAL